MIDQRCTKCGDELIYPEGISASICPKCEACECHECPKCGEFCGCAYFDTPLGCVCCSSADELLYDDEDDEL